MTTTHCATETLADLTERFPEFPSAEQAPKPVHDDRKLWTLFVDKEMTALMPADEYSRAKAVTTYFFRAVDQLKTRQMESVGALLRQGVEALQTLTHPYAHLYARQFQLSADALYAYKEGRYDLAFAQTVECVGLNDYLVRLGCPSMLFRSLEQNINLCLVYSRQGNVAAERRMLNGLIRYLLLGETDSALFGTAFADSVPQLRSGYLAFVAEGCLKTYVATAAGMLIRTAGANPEAEAGHFEELLGNIGEFAAPSLERVVLYNWLYLKRVYFRGAFDQFAQEVAEFLAEPYERRFDVLKFSLCQNLLFGLQSRSIRAPLLEARIQTYIHTKLSYKPGQSNFLLPGQTGQNQLA
ncbi:hypothetical protein F5984_21995 [Rudanella paleaurantiibacter]|uniref:Uncharacterized protein n=1 Tax=Rudanella paleaurantiibacter TaxID=2614655 RepID=A0A7J5TU28_9BACT|nr:hypothetical protein [Rudanella paleaurantiibacter]KAB7727303.1 hypothetical protein F5984_21995 [Rudanella paleaurantiibacter]